MVSMHKFIKCLYHIHRLTGVGAFVGLDVGALVGTFVGLGVGTFVGLGVGTFVGLGVGWRVGVYSRSKCERTSYITTLST
jgi:hypothetical protein